MSDPTGPMSIPASGELDAAITQLLQAHPAGLSEYELVKALRQAGCPALPEGPLSEPLVLFRTHFLVYNALYRLREAWWAEQSGHLEISALQIALWPYDPGSAGIERHDPLREYYLDLSNLEVTGEDDVVSLLASFWDRLQAKDHRQQALAVLGLEDPVDYDTIKRRYRKLAMDHHPDRGGEREQLQAINAAMEVLKAGQG